MENEGMERQQIRIESKDQIGVGMLCGSVVVMTVVAVTVIATRKSFSGQKCQQERRQIP